MHSVDIETSREQSNNGVIQSSTASDSSPGSLASNSTAASSDRPVQPASPPQLTAFLVSSPKAPPASLTASKPILTSYHSASNPQPFFPAKTVESPTTYQFPAVQPSGTRTPSPPGVSLSIRQSRSTPRPVRPRRHSMDERPTAPGSAGRTSAMVSTPSGDSTNQLEAKVVIRECVCVIPVGSSTDPARLNLQSEVKALAKLRSFTGIRLDDSAILCHPRLARVS